MPLSASPRGGSTGGRPSVAVVVVTLVAAALLGIAPAALSLSTTIALLAVCGVALILLLLRYALRGVPPAGAVAPASGDGLDVADTSAGADPRLRWQRVLFYLGSLTVTEATWRPALGLTLSEMFFIASFAGCAFAVLRGYSVARVPASLIAGAVIFAFGGAISSAGAHSPSDSLAEVVHALYVIVLWAWTGAMVLRTRGQLLTAISLWTVSAAANGFGALTQVFGLDSLAGALEGNRATGFADHPNDLGGATGVALVPALMLATRGVRARTSWSRLWRWLVVALIAVGLALSASVAGMAGALVAILVWLSAPSVRTSSRVAIVAALAAALVAATVVSGGEVTSPTERIEQVTSSPGIDSAAGSGEQRLEIARTAWPRISDDPVVGVGLDNPDTVVTVVSGGRTVPYQVHGALLAAWYGAGIFGLIGILVVFTAIFAAGWRTLAATTRDDDRLVGWAMLAAVAAFFVYAMTAPLFFQQYGWFAAVMLIAWSTGSVAGASAPSAARWEGRPAGLPGAELPAR